MKYLISAAIALSATFASAEVKEPEWEFNRLSLLCAGEKEVMDYVESRGFGRQLIFYGENNGDFKSGTVVTVNPETGAYAILLHVYEIEQLCLIGDGYSFKLMTPPPPKATL